MKLLTVGPDNIYTYDTVKEFFASFELGPKDLLVSIEVIYKQFLEPYANGANVSWTCRRSWRWPAVPPSTT